MVPQIQLLDIMPTEMNHHYQSTTTAQIIWGSNLRALNVMHVMASGLLRYMLKSGHVNYQELTKHTTHDA